MCPGHPEHIGVSGSRPAPFLQLWRVWELRWAHPVLTDGVPFLVPPCVFSAALPGTTRLDCGSQHCATLLGPLQGCGPPDAQVAAKPPWACHVYTGAPVALPLHFVLKEQRVPLAFCFTRLVSCCFVKVTAYWWSEPYQILKMSSCDNLLSLESHPSISVWGGGAGGSLWELSEQEDSLLFLSLCPGCKP